MRTGAPWRDLPEEFGKWGTAWDLFDKWNDDGTLDEILHRLRKARVDFRIRRRRALVCGWHDCASGPVCTAAVGKKRSGRAG